MMTALHAFFYFGLGLAMGIVLMLFIEWLYEGDSMRASNLSHSNLQLRDRLIRLHLTKPLVMQR